MHRVYEYHGGKIWLNVSESRMMYLRSIGAYEKDKVDFMTSFLKPGMTFIDVGACVGYFSLYAARLVEQSGAVMAIEPHPVNCAWLELNRWINEYLHIKILQRVAVSPRPWTEDYRGLLSLSGMSGHHTMLVPEWAEYTYPVERTTLDMVAHKADLIKIDVEGYELDVLDGAKSLLKDVPVVMIDIHPDYGVSKACVQERLCSHGLNAVLSQHGNSWIFGRE